MKEFIEEFRKRHAADAGGEIDSETLETLLATALKSAETELAELRERRDAMKKMVDADPRSGAFLRNWAEGNDPVVELIRQFGPELRRAIDDPAMQEGIAKANTDYLERLERERALTEEFEKNIAESLAMVDEKAEREGITDEELERAWEWLRRVTDEGIRGRVSEEALEMALNALRHDRDVATARHEGELTGRNEAIESHLRRLDSGDGTLASPGEGGAIGAGRRLPPLGVLDHYNTFKSVWD